MVGKNKLFDNDYKTKLADAVKDMKTSELQKFFDKYNKDIAIIYRNETEKGRKTILCEIIVQTKKFKGTEQFKKASSYLKKHGKEAK